MIRDYLVKKWATILFLFWKVGSELCGMNGTTCRDEAKQVISEEAAEPRIWPPSQAFKFFYLIDFTLN